MLRTSMVLACFVGCALALVTIKADAGVLSANPFAYNDGNGPLAGAWTGTAPFVNGPLVGTVDWAVFTSNTFNALFGGGGYIAPVGELVYAHQILTTGLTLGSTGMTITLAGNPAGNGGSFDAGGVGGVPAIVAFASPPAATWSLLTETDPLTPSDGLVYSSPNRPQLTGVPIVVDGGTSAATLLPVGIPGDVPIPEPASAFLVVVGGSLLAMLRCRQRV